MTLGRHLASHRRRARDVLLDLSSLLTQLVQLIPCLSELDLRARELLASRLDLVFQASKFAVSSGHILGRLGELLLER